MSEWISVNDRMPEYEAPVLGWDSECRFAIVVNYLNGEFFSFFGDEMTITHWMPLPEPPKAEGG